jgi:hypothetical protein
MMTVGYGDVFAVSPYGRMISVLNALWGAFIISLLVSSIGKIFELSDNQKKAISEITNSKRAAALIRAGIQYFNAQRDNKKVEFRNPQEYVYAQSDVAYFKETMIREGDKLKQERKENEDLVPGVDKHILDIEVMKEQIIDLNDKFDYLISLMIKN